MKKGKELGFMLGMGLSDQYLSMLYKELGKEPLAVVATGLDTTPMLAFPNYVYDQSRIIGFYDKRVSYQDFCADIKFFYSQN